MVRLAIVALSASIVPLLACPALAQETAPASSAAPLPSEQPATTPSPSDAPAAQATAPEDPNALRARELFQQGVTLSRQERWAEALSAFRQSAALVERPSTILNIATALQRLGRARECIATVDRYLAVSNADTDAEPRSRAIALREAMLASLAHVALAVVPEDAQLSIDGTVTPIVPGAVLDLDPGTYAFVLEREGYLTARFSLELAPGANVSRALSLSARPAEPGRLEVSTQVVGARIEVDGDVVGTDEIELEVLPGAHVVRVVANGWVPYERTVSIDPGTRERIDAQLSRPGGCQSVECEPAFWIVGGLLVAGAAATAIALPIALATEGPPYGGSANFHIDALRF